MREYLLTFCFFACISLGCFAQAPVINDIQPLNAGPMQTLVITGNGFSTDTSKLKVWFDHVKGKVLASTNFSIQVRVPAQARFTNVEVLNLVNNLSGKSKLKFLPSYGGSSFDVANTNLAYTFTDNNEMYDLASSDFDMDGDPDFVTTRGGPTSLASITDLNLFQNTSTIGTVSFTRTSLASGSPTSCITAGDLNGDGKPDIIATRGGSNREQIYIYKNTNTTPGVMSFGPKVTVSLDANQFAFRVVIRDLDIDGRPDLVVSNAYDDNDSTTDNQIYVFQNISSGGTIGFGPAIKLNVTGASITWGIDVQDLDGDTKPDVIVNRYQDSILYIFRNTSTGNLSFDPVQLVHSPGRFNNVTSSDINKDGLLDLVATSTLTNNIAIWINQSTPGTITLPKIPATVNTSRGPWGVDVSDIDGDGDADIIVSNKNGVGTLYDPTDVKVNILRQDSPGVFTKLDYVTTTPTRNLRVGDFDGDGKPDIAVCAQPVSGFSYTFNIIRNKNCWAPVITGPSNTLCGTQTIPLQVQQALGVTYDWKIDGTSKGVNSNKLTATAAPIDGTNNYTVTLTGTVDAACVNTSVAYPITTNSAAAFPSDPVIGNNTPCLGSALNLSTGLVATATYKWAGPNSFTSTLQNPSIPVVTAPAAGIYSLQVTLSNGCKSNLVTKQLDVASVPVLPVSASPSATGCVASTINLSVTGSGYTYQWNKAGTPIGGQTSSSLALTSLTAASEGDYSVTVTSVATTCSQETAKTTIKVFAPPTANFTFSGGKCKGDTIKFVDGSTGDNRGTLSYTWAFGDTQTSTQQNPKHPYASSGTFNGSLTVGYAGITGCTGSKPFSVILNDAVIPVLKSNPASPVCLGKNITLSIVGTYAYDSITWVELNKTQLDSVSFKLVTTDQFKTYHVKTKDQNGCHPSALIKIDSIPRITPIPFKIKTYQNKTSIAPNDTIKLTAPFGADAYDWNHGLTLTDSTIYNPVAKPSSTTNYLVIAKKAGFCDARDSLTVIIGEGSAFINAPVFFSPNSDGKNDFWIVQGTSNYPDWTMTIFDGHGSQVYQQKGFISWDGGSAPDGVYYYVFSNSSGKPNTGSVLLVRQKP